MRLPTQPARRSVVLMLTAAAAVCAFAAGPAARGAFAADQAELKLRLKKGQTYTITYAHESESTQTIPNVPPQKMTQKLSVDYRIDVEQVDAEGAATLKVLYEAISMSQAGPFGASQFDSRKQGEGAPDEPLAQGLSAMVGQSYTMVITPSGKVAEVRGVDKVLEAVLKQMKGEEGPVRDMVVETVKRQLSNEAVREQMQNLFAFYPEKPVAVGDTWTGKSKANAGVSLLMDNSYTLKERKGGEATIAVESKAAADPEAKPNNLGGMTVRQDVKGTQKGTITLDEKTGWAKRSDLTLDVKGHLVMSLGQEGGLEQRIPTQTKTRMTLSPRKAESPGEKPAAAPPQESPGESRKQG
jgi:hypothetical protein